MGSVQPGAFRKVNVSEKTSNAKGRQAELPRDEHVNSSLKVRGKQAPTPPG